MAHALIDHLSKTNLLRHRQRQDLLDEKAALEDQIAQPVLGSKAGTTNRGQLVRELKRLDHQLRSQSPRDDLTPAEKDVLAKKEVELREEILAGIPSQEEQRRNPPGNVHRHIRWEKVNKAKIRLWKNIRIQLDPTSEDPDLANYERFRPSKMPENGAATHMVNAQIPGHFAMSPQAKEHWPSEMPPQGTVNSPLRQAKDKKVERSAAERKAWGEKMKAAKAAKREAADRVV